MRIEFHTDRETVAELRLIIYVCEQAIAAHERQIAQLNRRVADESAGQFALNVPGFGAPFANFIPPAPPPVDNAFVAPGAQQFSTVDPNTGEVISAHELARRAFGADFTKEPGLTAAEAFGRFTPAGAVTAATAPAVPPVAAPAAVSSSTNLPPVPTLPANALPVGVVERDANGDPYDARIHSEARTKNNDGSWRFRRKLDEAVKAQVLAEIRSAPVGLVQPNGGAVPPPPPPPAAVVPPPPPPPPVTLPVPVPPPPAARLPDPPVAVVVPPPPVNPTVTAPVPPSATAASSAAATASGPITFRDLVVKLNKAMAAGTVTQESLQLACVELGLDSPAALHSPEYAHLAASLDKMLFPNG